MLTLNVVKRGLPPTFNYKTEPLHLNPNSIVSIAPASRQATLIKEVDGSPVAANDISEIEYNVGGRSEKIIVLGNYAEILRRARSERRELLNG